MKLCAVLMPAAMMLVTGMTPAIAGYEDIQPKTAGSPDQWQPSSGSDKVLLVTDADDGTYIYEDSAWQIQDFALTDPAGLTEDDTIDSVNVIWRGQDSGNGTNQVRANLYLSGNTSYGSTINLTTSWTDYTDSFTDKPGGSGWTIDDVNNLEVHTECVILAKNRTVRCSEISVRVYFSRAAEGISPRRKKIKTEFGG